MRAITDAHAETNVTRIVADVMQHDKDVKTKETLCNADISILLVSWYFVGIQNTDWYQPIQIDIVDVLFVTLQYSTDFVVGNQNSDCVGTTFKTLIGSHTRAYPWVVARLPFSRSYPMGDAHVVVHCSLTLGRPNLGHCNITLQNIKLGISQSDGLFFSIFPLSQDFD